MPVRSVTNQYAGINAHLHSLMQAEGGWSDFHARHIVHLADAMTAQLRTSGYVVQVEQSLQIRRIGDVPRRPKADVLVFDRTQNPSFQSATGLAMTEAIPIPDLMAENELSEARFRSIVIYELDASTGRIGEPVTWIELLSPTNKGNSEDADLYRSKRMDVMVSGLVFVEIDYLHETPPTFPKIPIYPFSQHPKASAYRIVVLDPRPEVEAGKSWVTPIQVDQKIPEIEIPLNRNDVLMFDFGSVYQKTFNEVFLGDQVDYERMPLNFERYSAPDQARIAARMVAVLQAFRQGVDLTNDPLPIEALSLETALARIKALSKE